MLGGGAGLFATAGWLFGKAADGAFNEPGNSHPLERLVLPGVEPDGWKTELKMASLESGQELDRRGSCSPLCSLQECAGRDMVGPPRWMVCVLAGCVCHPDPSLGQAGTGGGLMSQSLVELLLESSFSTRIQQKQCCGW